MAAREQQPTPSDPSRHDPSWADLVGRQQERPQELRLEPLRLAPLQTSPVQPPPGVATVPAQASSQRWAPSLELSLNDSPTQPIPRLSSRTMELPVVVQEPDYVVVDLISAGLSTVDEVPTRPAVPMAPRLRAQAADQALVDLSDRGYRDQARRSAVTVVSLVGAVIIGIAVLGILTRM